MTFTRGVGALAASATAVLALGGLAAPAVHAQSPHRSTAPAAAGPLGSPITLATGSQYDGYDITTDSAGTAYVAWIASTASVDKTVNVCVLPPGAAGCAGGIHSTSATDQANARDLHVVSTSPGTATVVWFTQPSLTTGALLTVTYAGGALSSAVTAGTAPSNGDLKDAQVGPDGQIWAVTEDAASSVSNVIGVRDGLGSAPTNITASFPVGNANLAFNGSQPVVAVDHYGSVSDPVYVASGPAWSGFTPVAKTWTLATDDVVTTSHGARLVTSQPDAGYHPVAGAWNGSTFTGLGLTGDTNACAPSSNDLSSDPSGRVASASNECSDVAVANLADTLHAGVVRFPSGGTIAGGTPQIASLAGGTAWVAWSIEDGVNDSLFVRSVQLPAGEVTKTKTEKGVGSIKVTAPAGCLPDVSVKPKVKVKAHKPWKVEKTTVMLDKKRLRGHKPIKGASLHAGSHHKVTVKVTFAASSHGGRAARPHTRTSSLKVSQGFTAC